MSDKIAMRSVKASRLVRFCLLAGVVCLGAVLPFSRTAGEGLDVPLDIQYELSFRVLSFDAALEPRHGPNVRVGIVYQSGYVPSAQTRQQLEAVIKADTHKVVRGRQISFRSIDFAGPQSLEQALANEPVDVLYVLPLRGVDVKQIAEISRARKIRTLSTVPAYVRQGLAIGIVRDNEKPRVLFNVAALTEEGAEFPLKVIRYGAVVE